MKMQVESRKNHGIAVIGIGCNYPGAKTPLQFWENILARRRQFREMPDVRMPNSEYFDPDSSIPDKTYQNKAAVLDGYSFDWLGKRIPKSAYESTDIVHWLALDTALQALSDTNYTRENISKEKCGVVLGNTLTGEFTRSNNMRLKWPYVRKVLEKSLSAKGLSHLLGELEGTMESYYKSVFAPVTEDSLAGGLANTIAGRVCNYLDLHGGGYIVDGACSSSLLAVTLAANYLETGQMDMVITGGVDVSLDTFELIGFAKTKALTMDEMRVYDKNGKGFLPGEGCGMVVLKRLEDAIKDGDPIYATLEGWGIASDGKGGITAPSAEGQSRALIRAHEKANINPADLSFIEGHGTGTTVGDRIELEGISIALNRNEGVQGRSCGVTSLKSIVGHTKAAAGIGAFIKTAIAVNQRVFPPTAGLKELNPILSDKASAIYPIQQGKKVSDGEDIIAGVSAMGFGGINSHVVLKSYGKPSEKLKPELDESKIMVSNQDSEVFFFSGNTMSELINSVRDAQGLAKGISYAELADFSFSNNLKIKDNHKYRAAVIASVPFDLERKLKVLFENLNKQTGTKHFELEGQSIVFATKKEGLKIGALYPGQGAQRLNMTYKIIQRFDWAKEMVAEAGKIFASFNDISLSDSVYRPLDRAKDEKELNIWKDILKQTNIAQPAITLSSLIWDTYLKKLGVNVTASTGHSLGELMAFYSGGCLEKETLLKFAAFRGKSMSVCGMGTMASLMCPGEIAQKYVDEAPGYVVVANLNAPEQTVISGDEESIHYISKRAGEDDVPCTVLPVSAAFHSKLIEESEEQIRNFNDLKSVTVDTSKVKVVSGVTGKVVSGEVNLAEYFANQAVSQVNFIDAINTLKDECDILVEIGSGKILSGLAGSIQDKVQAFPVEARSNDDVSFNKMLANIYINGVDLNIREIYEGRLIRDFVPASQLEFLVNPCERPFPEIETERISSVAQRPDILGNLELPEEVYHEYIRERSDYIREVIQADLKYYKGGTGNAIKPIIKDKVRTTTPNQVIKAVTSQTGSVKSVVYNKIESVTGFPASNFNGDMKLLDDFNLDSIKAGTVLNDIFKTLEIKGKINASNYANASLDVIIAAIEKVAPKKVSAESSALSMEIDVEKDVLALVEEKTGFPKDQIKPEFRLLNDLNLDSIKAGSFLNDILKKYNLRGKIETARHLNASISEIVDAVNSVLPKESISTASQSVSNDDVQSYLFNLVETTTGFPKDQLKADFKLLDDLNLDSIKAASFINAALKNFKVDNRGEVSKYSNASLGEIAVFILSSISQDKDLVQEEEIENNTVTTYNVELIETTSNYKNEEIISYWKDKKIGIVCSPKEQKKAEVLLSLIKRETTFTFLDYDKEPGNAENIDSLLVLMPSSKEITNVKTNVKILSYVAAISTGNAQEIGFIQVGDGQFKKGGNLTDVQNYFSSAAFAASLHLERPDLKIRVLEFNEQADSNRVTSVFLGEFLSQGEYKAIGLDAEQKTWEAVYEFAEANMRKRENISITPEDVVLVTGGAKGITAECAFSLAVTHKCKMALVGSSKFNGEEGEIKNTLDKYKENGLTAEYFDCNITDADSCIQLFKNVTEKLGDVAAIVHGAGRNVPRRAETVSYEQALSEISPKLIGAYNLYNASKPELLKAFIGFTSIIGVTGMNGNSWYAFSNEALDLFIREIGKKHNIHTLTLAYSVWSEVGMGERMGSTKVLSNMGIGSIAPEQGIAEFMNWIQNETSDQQIVVSAGMGALDTWRPKPAKKPVSQRYLQDIVNYIPNKELTVRCKLSKELDVYTQDHDYRGSLLFPTVFGMEAMAQAASMLFGKDSLESVQISEVSLLKPIVVADSGETEIEITAKVIHTEDGLKAKVGIATEMTDFSEDHFSAVVELKSEKAPEIMDMELSDSLLPINPKEDLYGWLLFQGERFQLMEKISKISSNEVVFTTAQLETDTSDICFSQEVSSPFAIGSPLLRDTLLQSVQLCDTTNIVLPIGINNWKIRNPKQQINGGKVICKLVEKSADTALCDVYLVNEKNEIIESIEGYKVKVMEPTKDFPAIEKLNNLGEFFTSKVNDKLISIKEIVSEKLEIHVSKHLTSFNLLSEEERHAIENEEFNKFFKAQSKFGQDAEEVNLTWNKNGKPEVNIEGVDISISHTGSFLLMAIGEGKQGCDLEMIEQRNKEDWNGLLGDNLINLADSLSNVDNNFDVSCTRVWGVKEACIKAFGEVKEDVVVQKASANEVVFKVNDNNADFFILSTLVDMLPGKETLMTLLVNYIEKSEEKVMTKVLKDDGIFDEAHGKFVTEFFTTFKDCRGFFGKTYFTDFPQWMGSLREYILAPVKNQLLKDLGSGEYGMVTNDSSIKVYGEADTLDKVVGRLWLTEKSDLPNSFMDISYEWLRYLPDGRLEKLGECLLSTTWVKIEDRGIVKLSPIPGYFYEYLDKHLRKNTFDPGDKEVQYLGLEDLGALEYESKAMPRPSIMLNKKIYQTGIYNANTVGNLYYSNYYDWQAKNIENFMFEHVPEVFLTNGKAGEFICLEANVNHLQEAMPFEEIEVHMYIEQKFENGMKLFFEYFSNEKSTQKRKLAYGSNTLIWAKRNNETEIPKAVNVPEKVFAEFLKLEV